MVEERRDDMTVDVSTTAAQRRAHRARIVQIVLGCLWILDAALQFQPRMFGTDLINQMMLPSAAGQPAPVAWSITQLAHFVRPDVGVWNFFFGALQLGIGVGMLFRRTVKPAIVAMAIWAFGVWWFGEGFGMLLTGTASPLTGAPGRRPALPLGGVVGVAHRRGDVRRCPWHRVVRRCHRSSGHERPALRLVGVLGAVRRVVALPGQPGERLGRLRAADRGGRTTVVVRAFRDIARQRAAAPGVAVAVGAGVRVLGDRGGTAVAAGASNRSCWPGWRSSSSFWVSGMALGGILTGMGTDPNAAPLVALLAFAMVPTLHAAPASVPGREFLRRHPVAGVTTSAMALGGPGDSVRPIRSPPPRRRPLDRVRIVALELGRVGDGGHGDGREVVDVALRTYRQGWRTLDARDGRAVRSELALHRPAAARPGDVRAHLGVQRDREGSRHADPQLRHTPDGCADGGRHAVGADDECGGGAVQEPQRGDGGRLRADHRPALSSRPLLEVFVHAGQVRPRPRSRAVLGLHVHALRPGAGRRDVPHALGGRQGADARWVPDAVARAHQPV